MRWECAFFAISQNYVRIRVRNVPLFLVYCLSLGLSLVVRVRRQVVFDRLLARLFPTDPAPWVLKGGYALELRFRTARATIDIDLTVETVAVAITAPMLRVWGRCGKTTSVWSPS